MNIQRYISSGVLECYVTGLLSFEEEEEVELMRKLYPELDVEIDRLEYQLESYLVNHAVAPSTGLKQHVMEIVRGNKRPTVPSPKVSTPLPLLMRIFLIAALTIIILSLTAIAILSFYLK